MPTPRRALIALALAGSLLLAGCSGGSNAADDAKAGSDASHAATTAAERMPAGPIAAQAPTAQHPLTTVPDDSGIDGVVAWDTTVDASGEGGPGAEEHTHVTGPVSYAVTPPAGGPHDPIWMNAGVYDKPVPSERAVHNLEHGAVWITYRPSLPAAEVQKLVDFVGTQTLIPEQIDGLPGQANRYLDLTPWADETLPSPIVVSAWGHQLQLTDAADPRLQKFVDTFRHSQRYSPEYGAPVDGVPVETGGVAAEFGGAVADPPGSIDESGE